MQNVSYGMLREVTIWRSIVSNEGTIKRSQICAMVLSLRLKLLKTSLESHRFDGDMEHHGSFYVGPSVGPPHPFCFCLMFTLALASIVLSWSRVVFSLRGNRKPVKPLGEEWNGCFLSKWTSREPRNCKVILFDLLLAFGISSARLPKGIASSPLT